MITAKKFRDRRLRWNFLTDLGRAQTSLVGELSARIPLRSGAMLGFGFFYANGRGDPFVGFSIRIVYGMRFNRYDLLPWGPVHPPVRVRIKK